MAQTFNDNTDAATIRAVFNAFVAEYNTHAANVGNPHGVTKAQVGLGNCDNTSDANKPASVAVLALIAGLYPNSNPAAYINAAQVLNVVLSTFASDTGIIDATTTLLHAVQKLYGNHAALDAAVTALTGTVNSKEDIARASVVSDTVTFDKPSIFGTPAAPRGAGAITVDFTGAKFGVQSIMIHNAAGAPTVPASFKVTADSLPYSNGNINIYEFRYYSNTHVTYRITHE